MLDNHSDLAIPPESHFIAPFLKQGIAEFNFENFKEVIGKHPRYKKWELSIDELWEPECVPSGSREAFRTIYGAYARQRAKTRFGDKTPGYSLQVGGLSKLIPESVFIHLIRDGHDVALSLLDVSFGPSTIEEAAKFWINRVTTARADGRSLGPKRYLEIRYEQLVDLPTLQLRQICKLVNLPFEAGMLDHQKNAREIADSTILPSAHRNLGSPLRQVRNWRAQMAPDMIKRFETIAGETLVNFGYSVAK